MIIKPQFQIKDNKNGLYLVSTPIGNLKDITFRAIETLKNSDYILCEDTRVSKNLFNRYEIKSRLISNHKFNEKKNINKIIELLKSGKMISLISDAGTPGISDPGKILVNECIKNNINIIPIPGPTAVTTAVSISGFSEKFFFYGFFPEKKSEIKENFKKLSILNSSIIFFISAKKINKSINIIKEYFSGRDIVICKEISKFYEEYHRSSVDKINVFNNLKGEITIVISELKNQKKASNILSESDKKKIDKLIDKLTIKEIINLISEGKNISKKEIYAYCLKIKNDN